MPGKSLLALLLLSMAVCIGCRQPSPDAGAVLFRKNCAGCHSPRPGQPRTAPSLDGYFHRNPQPTIRQTRRTILDGGRYMPPFRDRLSSGQVDDLIAYVKSQP